jgi:hypothetical protein
MITLHITPKQLAMLTYAMQRSVAAIPDLNAAMVLRDKLEAVGALHDTSFSESAYDLTLTKQTLKGG